MSHITVSAEKVIKCCQNWQTYNDIRDCQNAARILAKKAKTKTFWLFGSEIGYQKAYEYFTEASGGFDNLSFYACFWKGETAETVKNLLLLARHGGPVILSEKHAFILSYEDISFDKDN